MAGAWWDTAGVYHPVLKKYAIRILSQPCKCSCDIKPSAFEVAQRNIMNKAVPITQDNSAYTIMNAKIMEKFGSSEEQILTPIDLDNCNELPDYADPQQTWWDDQMELISENTDDDDDDQMDSSHLDGKVSSILNICETFAHLILYFNFLEIKICGWSPSNSSCSQISPSNLHNQTTCSLHVGQ